MGLYKVHSSSWSYKTYHKGILSPMEREPNNPSCMPNGVTIHGLHTEGKNCTYMHCQVLSPSCGSYIIQAQIRRSRELHKSTPTRPVLRHEWALRGMKYTSVHASTGRFASMSDCDVAMSTRHWMNQLRAAATSSSPNWRPPNRDSLHLAAK